MLSRTSPRIAPTTLLAAWLLSIAALAGLVLHLHAHDTAQLEALSRAIIASRGPGSPGAGSPAAARIATAAAASTPGTAAPGIDAETIDAIAARVAGRLRGGDGSAVRDAATGSAATLPAPAEALTADQHAALDRASQVVDRVLDRRQLTRDDMRALRQQLAAVNDPGTTTEVYRRLIVALNTSQIASEQPDLLTAP